MAVGPHSSLFSSEISHPEFTPLARRTRTFFSDLTNTPTPQFQQRKVPPATSVQRFSLRCRRRLYPYGCLFPAEAKQAYAKLKTASGQVVQLCSCAWQKENTGIWIRECHRNAEDHEEYKLLQDMGKRFRAEISVKRPSSMDRNVDLEELEVYFILQPDCRAGIVAGYAALKRHEKTRGTRGTTEDGPPRKSSRLCGGASVLELVQLYLDPNFRGRGVARAALSVLLARRSQLWVNGHGAFDTLAGQATQQSAESLSQRLPTITRVLSRLGFLPVPEIVHQESANAFRNHVLFRRPLSQASAMDAENVE